MQKVTDWIKANQKLAAAILAIICTTLGGLTGWQFSVQTGPQPGIIIVLPDGDSFPVSADTAAGDPKVVQAAEWVVAAKLALNAAILILERRAPQTPSDRDDKLLAFLKLIRGDRSQFERAVVALQPGGP